MPSFLGPTNIPPLQALALGTPAIVSDKHFFPPAVLDRCVVVGVEDADGWADAFTKFSTKQRVDPVVWELNFEERLAGILGQFERRRENWRR
jgi:glycosyltransferase involved in cell wall biosynthesis